MAGQRLHPSPADDRLCPRMPVLDTLHADLGGVAPAVRALFGLQHLLGSTASLIRTIADGRIHPDDVFLLGKPYSANRRVVRFLGRRLGYRVHPHSLRQSTGRAGDDEIDRGVESVLRAIRRSLCRLDDPDARVLLIDDGGRAIRMLHARAYADIRDRFTCVEQTRCGIRTLEDTRLRIPVINVAESRVKLEHESPMIAGSVLHELGKRLVSMESGGIPTGRRALIIGYGAIGRAVSAEMRRQGREVSVHDFLEERTALARRDGFRTHESLRSALGAGELIVGCTGKPVLDRSDHAHLPDGTILVSASSADVEFRGWQIRVEAECLGGPYGSHPCFSLYRRRNGDGCFYLVNGGFPVNFTGGIDPISPEEIQLTRGLLYLGAVQASRTVEPGLHELDDARQEELLACFASATRRRAA